MVVWTDMSEKRLFWIFYLTTAISLTAALSLFFSVLIALTAITYHRALGVYIDFGVGIAVGNLLGVIPWIWCVFINRLSITMIITTLIIPSITGVAVVMFLYTGLFFYIGVLISYFFTAGLWLVLFVYLSRIAPNSRVA